MRLAIHGVLLSTVLYVSQNKMNINDWSAIQTLFDKLNKQLEKSIKVSIQPEILD